MSSLFSNTAFVLGFLAKNIRCSLLWDLSSCDFKDTGIYSSVAAQQHNIPLDHLFAQANCELYNVLAPNAELGAGKAYKPACDLAWLPSAADFVLLSALQGDIMLQRTFRPRDGM